MRSISNERGSSSTALTKKKAKKLLSIVAVDSSSDDELPLVRKRISLTPKKKYINFGHILVEDYDHMVHDNAHGSLIT